MEQTINFNTGSFVDRILQSVGPCPNPDVDMSAVRQFMVDMTNENIQLGQFDFDKANTMMKMPTYDKVAEMMEKQKSRMVKVVPQQPNRGYSMFSTLRSAEEIQDDIHVLTTFLACNELIFANEMQRYSFHILDMLKEKNLYRHELKKYANRLKDVTDNMMWRSNDTDRHVTLKQCLMATPYHSYGNDFYEEGGGLLNRMAINFHRNFELKLKRIQMDNLWIAKEMKLKHPDLISEIFTLSALARTDIELFNEVQKRIESVARGRLKSKSRIKSTHSEAMLNASMNLSDKFVNRTAIMPEEPALLMRKHLAEFQKDITGEEQFEFFNGQFMALKMDYIEYYLARLRMDMDKGRMKVAQIRDVWYRLGKKHAVKKFFTELASVKLPKKEFDAWDVVKKISDFKGEQNAMNTFRRMCLDGTKIEPDKESDEVWQCRVLRVIARQHGGLLPDDVIRSLMKSHLTKKGVMERLELAGFELRPTLQKVKKMKASELKQL